MEHIATEDLSEQQMFILKERVKGRTYECICLLFERKFHFELHDNKLSTALRQSALGNFWTSGMDGGNDPYLCTADLNTLKEIIINAQEMNCPFDCSDVIDEAHRLKILRIKEGIEFLHITKSD